MLIIAATSRSAFLKDREGKSEPGQAWLEMKLTGFTVSPPAAYDSRTFPQIESYNCH